MALTPQCNTHGYDHRVSRQAVCVMDIDRMRVIPTPIWPKLLRASDKKSVLSNQIYR
ncbi:hypothetical protein [Shewanella sp.]|uniref:hypothetical protein n=1 Tax=Shewanella sp. TaxID=50422 RepID=UPI001ED77302|nr:hypothetical protein [Shewanella sp.]NRB22739.1 hypothetical protein [Shewanella sp.]